MRSPFYFLCVLAIACTFSQTASGAELRTVFSDHYAIHTDLDYELTQNLARRMDAMWEEYATRLHDFPLPSVEKKFDAYLFSRKVDYMRLTGNRFQNTGGIFDANKQQLAAYLEGQGRDGLRQVLPTRSVPPVRLHCRRPPFAGVAE